MLEVSGTFYRIIFTADVAHVIAGANQPEGRFHHDGQAALYLSASPEGARVAVSTYATPADPPRVMAALDLAGARVLDLRDEATLASLGLDGTEPAAKWQEERAMGRSATSWRASDAVRATGADGMIYASRKAPQLWHLVLFHWNRPGRAHVSASGPLVELSP